MPTYQHISIFDLTYSQQPYSFIRTWSCQSSGAWDHARKYMSTRLSMRQLRRLLPPWRPKDSGDTRNPGPGRPSSSFRLFLRRDSRPLLGMVIPLIPWHMYDAMCFQDSSFGTSMSRPNTVQRSSWYGHGYRIKTWYHIHFVSGRLAVELVRLSKGGSQKSSLTMSTTLCLYRPVGGETAAGNSLSLVAVWMLWTWSSLFTIRSSKRLFYDFSPLGLPSPWHYKVHFSLYDVIKSQLPHVIIVAEIVCALDGICIITLLYRPAGLPARYRTIFLYSWILLYNLLCSLYGVGLRLLLLILLSRRCDLCWYN